MDDLDTFDDNTIDCTSPRNGDGDVTQSQSYGNKSRPNISTGQKRKNAVMEVILEEKREKDTPKPAHEPKDKNKEVGTRLDLMVANPVTSTENSRADKKNVIAEEKAFCCVISSAGVIMGVSPTPTANVIFAQRNSWIGEPFIRLLHPHDHNVFTSRLEDLRATYDQEKIPQEATASSESETRVPCRMLRHCFSTNVASGSGSSADETPTEPRCDYAPFLLKITLERHARGVGWEHFILIDAFLYKSYFKTSSEVVRGAVPFELRHSPNATILHIGEESAQYLGLLPQQLINENLLLLCHRNDLGYLRHVYVTIIKEGFWPRSKCHSFKMRCQNGGYVTLESEWSCFLNSRTNRVDFVVAKLYLIKGPEIPDVFQPSSETLLKRALKTTSSKNQERCIYQIMRDSIVHILTCWTPTTLGKGGKVDAGKGNQSNSSNERDQRHHYQAPTTLGKGAKVDAGKGNQSNSSKERDQRHHYQQYSPLLATAALRRSCEPVEDAFNNGPLGHLAYQEHTLRYLNAFNPRENKTTKEKE